MQATSINSQERFLVEPPRNTPIVREVDVLVCGGGVSGIGAALGAARAGAKTMVIEKNAFLGGPPRRSS
jgi:heterodisulfide reductase subunit A-like polyferredoxin